MSQPTIGRRLRGLAAWLPVTLLISACDTQVPDTATVADAPETDKAPATVALVMKTLTNPFFVDMERGAPRPS